MKSEKTEVTYPGQPRLPGMTGLHSSSHLMRLATMHRPSLQTFVKAAMVLSLRVSTTLLKITSDQPAPLSMPWLMAKSASQARWVVMDG